MAKELIFMGRKDGKVRLALFDSSHGDARKLPVKEVPEAVFVKGIKDETLPVRGFSVNKGRISCKYGDWYKLPEIGEGRAFSIFGLVHFGKVETDSEGYYPDNPHSLTTYIQQKFFGLASVEWSTGMFRVLSPATYFYLTDRLGVFCYTYDGPVTKSKIRPKQLDDFYDKADYVFDDCVATESLAEISQWAGMNEKSAYVFYQWLYQKCEPVACREDDEADFRKSMLDGHNFGGISLLLLGTNPIECLEIAENVSNVSVRTSRSIKSVDVNKHYYVEVYGVNGVDVYCQNTANLTFTYGTKARLIRGDNPKRLTVYGWEGYDDSDNDYSGMGIETLSSCFQKQPLGGKFVIDANSIINSFTNMVGAEVVCKNIPDKVTGSFCNFIGDVKVAGLPYLDYSFNKAEIKSPLDLTKNLYLCNSCNDLKAEIILPEALGWVERRVFHGTGINHIKLKLDGSEPVISRNMNGSLTIDNPNLTVEVECLTTDRAPKFQYGDIRDLYYKAPQGSLSPRFQYTSVFPTQPVAGVTDMVADAFVRVSKATLNLGMYPDISVIPKDMANDCKCSTVIFGPNIKKIEAGAFVNCDSIRWVYIPKEVEAVDHFIRRPRIPYTIITQQGSAADAYAKKYGIDVKYVGSVDEFHRLTQEIPEEMEGAVAIAIISGKGDGEDAAVLQACEPAEIPEDYMSKMVFIEKTDASMDDVEWVNNLSFSDDKPDFNVTESPRLHSVMSILSNGAEFNPDVLKVESNMVKKWGTNGMFRSGQYAMAYAKMDDAQGDDHLIWLVLNGTKVINAFTEKVSDNKSSISIRSALKAAKEADSKLASPTMLSNLIEHISITGRGISVRGKAMKDATTNKVYTALKNTYALLGAYKGTGSTRYFIGLDMTTLNFVSFKLSSGVVVDDGRLRAAYHDIWGMGLRAIGGTQDKELESLEGFTRVHSIIGGADAMVKAFVCKDELPKCKEYDFTRPLKEAEAMQTIVTVLSGRGPSTTTVAELRDALKACGLAQPLTKKMWEKIYKNTYFNGTADYHCSDGKVKMYDKRYEYVSWFVFDDATAFAFALSDGILNKLQSIVTLYETDFDSIAFCEEHYALVNKVLPASEFVIVRDFRSGGTYHRYGSTSACIAVSRISGKPCVAVRIAGYVVPIFWTNTFADAVRICELCGYIVFNANQDWAYKNGDNITSNIFTNESEYDNKTPSFKYYSRQIKNTRDYIRRGEVDGFACPDGKPELFALAMKNPKASDYVEGGAN